MSCLYAGVYVHGGIVLLPAKLTWIPVAWSLVGVPTATLIVAWFYREGVLGLAPPQPLADVEPGCQQ